MHQKVSFARLASTLAGCALAFTLAAPAARAQVSFGIHIGTPPPPLRYEARPPIPGPGFVWVDGFWEPFHGRYRWHPGYWNRPPFEGAYYVHPHWDHYPDGWHMHDGYWAHEDHGDHYWDHHENDRDHHDHDDHPHP
jgi:hypothetical protein